MSTCAARPWAAFFMVARECAGHAHGDAHGHDRACLLISGELYYGQSSALVGGLVIIALVVASDRRLQSLIEVLFRPAASGPDLF